MIGWGSRHYSQLIEAIEDTRAREDAELCRFATSVSYSRLLSSKGRENDGLSWANKATDLLSDYQKLVQRPTPRQTLELELALLQASESVMDPLTKLQKWTELASLAESSQEHGIQTTCLSRYAQTAAAAKLYKEIDHHQAKLEEIEKDLERDMPSVLDNRCGLWRAEDRSGWASILEWFDIFEKQFPTSRFLLGDPDTDDELLAWDVPTGKFREEQLKYLMFSAYHQPELAQNALSASTQILKHVPVDLITERGLQGRWLLEWQYPLVPTPLGPVDVLAKRIYLRFGGVRSGEQRNDWARYAELKPAELKSVLFCWPFSSVAFAEKLASLQEWFEADKALFDPEASQLLIAQLRMAQMVHAKETRQTPLVISNEAMLFVRFVESLSESSLKQYLIRNALIARQQLLDTELIFSPSLNGESSHRLSQECWDLIQRYEETYLAGEFAKIGGLYGRLAEIKLRHRASSNYLEDSKRLYEKAFAYFDNLRSELSVLDGSLALQIKMSIRQGLTGDQQLLSRAMSLLIATYSATGTDPHSRTAIAFMIWDFVQRFKARALNDILSSASPISASDKKSLQEDVDASKLVREWQSLLHDLSESQVLQSS